jgi:hypothetical protein
MPRTKFAPTAIIRVVPWVSKPPGDIAKSVSMAELLIAPIPIPEPMPVQNQRGIGIQYVRSMRSSPMLCFAQTMGIPMGT